jgi:hypothetical protein
MEPSVQVNASQPCAVYAVVLGLCIVIVILGFVIVIVIVNVVIYAVYAVGFESSQIRRSPSGVAMAVAYTSLPTVFSRSANRLLTLDVPLWGMCLGSWFG